MADTSLQEDAKKILWAAHDCLYESPHNTLPFVEILEADNRDTKRFADIIREMTGNQENELKQQLGITAAIANDGSLVIHRVNQLRPGDDGPEELTYKSLSEQQEKDVLDIAGSINNRVIKEPEYKSLAEIIKRYKDERTEVREALVRNLSFETKGAVMPTYAENQGGVAEHRTLTGISIARTPFWMRASPPYSANRGPALISFDGEITYVKAP